MNHRLPEAAMKQSRNGRAYALGRQERNGFHVRRIVWGRLAATYERRLGEEIRRAIVLVERGKKR